MGEFVKDLVACINVAPSFHHATMKFASNIMSIPSKNHNIACEAPTKAYIVETGILWTRYFSLSPSYILILHRTRAYMQDVGPGAEVDSDVTSRVEHVRLHH